MDMTVKVKYIYCATTSYEQNDFSLIWTYHGSLNINKISIQNHFLINDFYIKYT